ncbi:MAG TPA: tetratricopeptide repeat protein [Candidatus Binataceae bacterium]|nr:tetratricopeptide repeat protein [Candidatus Binataceae bacterium]
MKFCPQCGEPLLAGAKFCVECGRELATSASGAGPDIWSGSHARDSVLRRSNLTMAFTGVFLSITVLGLGAAAWIYLRTPSIVREQVEKVGAPELPMRVVKDQPPGSSDAPQTQPAPHSASAAPAAGAPNSGGLPPGHPAIELPTEARSFIDKIEKDARSKNKDISAWNKFGAVSMRAAMFDQTYYAKAEEAYSHVLQLDPENTDALRGIGDIDYDKQHYDQAVAAYEHYLKHKPDDPEVRTDLGTMFLYTGNADQAVVQYQKAVTSKPDFFQAYYNMGIAYAQENQPDLAVSTLNKAITLAPDDTIRAQVKDLLAKLTSPPSPTGAEQPAAQAAASPASDFNGEMESMVRGLPIAGQRIDTVQWPEKLHGKVILKDFPMDQMPPFAKDKFVADIKSRIDTAKKDHQVSDKVQIDLVDGPSGRVMATVND